MVSTWLNAPGGTLSQPEADAASSEETSLWGLRLAPLHPGPCLPQPLPPTLALMDPRLACPPLPPVPGDRQH